MQIDHHAFYIFASWGAAGLALMAVIVWLILERKRLKTELKVWEKDNRK
jgi:heme exporter protein CcmD